MEKITHYNGAGWDFYCIECGKDRVLAAEPCDGDARNYDDIDTNLNYQECAICGVHVFPENAREQDAEQAYFYKLYLQRAASAYHQPIEDGNKQLIQDAMVERADWVRDRRYDYPQDFIGGNEK